MSLPRCYVTFDFFRAHLGVFAGRAYVTSPLACSFYDILLRAPGPAHFLAMVAAFYAFSASTSPRSCFTLSKPSHFPASFPFCSLRIRFLCLSDLDFFSGRLALSGGCAWTWELRALASSLSPFTLNTSLGFFTYMSLFDFSVARMDGRRSRRVRLVVHRGLGHDQRLEFPSLYMDSFSRRSFGFSERMKVEVSGYEPEKDLQNPQFYSSLSNSYVAHFLSSVKAP